MKDEMAAAGRKVLLVDGDPASRQALAEQLARACDAAITTVDGGMAALAALAQAPFDLAVIALPLPDAPPAGLIRACRGSDPPLPVLLLAEAEAPELAPDARPDDVILRPVRLNLLLVRIEALLARRGERAIGPYDFRPADRLLIARNGEREIRLTEKEVAILDYLLAAGDRTTPRELLLNEVWGYNSGVATHTLETHVYRLRRKIEADPAKAEILVSEPGGYRLVLRGAAGG